MEFEIPENISELSLEAANALLADIVKYGSAIAKSDEAKSRLDDLRALGSAKEEVEAHIASLTEEAEKLQAEISSLQSAFDSSDEEDADEDADESGDDEDADDEGDEKQAAATRRTFDVSKFEVTEMLDINKPKKRVIVAAADAQGHREDASISLGELGNQIYKQRPSLSAGDRRLIARASNFDLENRTNAIGGVHDSRKNTKLIAEFKARNEIVEEGNARTAAGGFCCVDQVERSLPDCNMGGTPVQDLFRTVPIDGCYSYRRGINYQDLLPGTGVWTNADDIAVDPNDNVTWKECVRVDCATQVDAVVDALYRCLRYGTFQEFSDPDMVQAHINALDVAMDVTSERWALERLDAQIDFDYSYAATNGMGLSYDVLDMMEQLAAIIEIQSRLNSGTYTAILPSALLRLIASDAYKRGFRVGEEDILADIRRITGINVATRMDDRLLAPQPVVPASGSALGGADDLYPNGFDIYVVNRDSYHRGVGMELAMGMTRDADLLLQNDVQLFGEQFVSLEKDGCEPAYKVAFSSVCTNGARPGLVTPVTCVPGA